MKISNYSLSYGREFKKGQMDVLKFLSLCRELGVEGASLHIGNLESTQPDYLKRVRRTYLDLGLSMSQFAVSTNFGKPQDQHEEEFQRAREAIRVGMFLGAPALRIFVGSPPNEDDRAKAFDRAAASIRKLCEEAAQIGMPIGLQNHNHGGLCRTGADIIRFFKAVDHPNLTFVLDTGQFAGCGGASGKAPAELRDADYLASIRQTASLARYVRAKFYNPRKDGSEPFVDYDKVFDILRSVHYPGFIDIVYEPGVGTAGPGEDARTAIPRIAKFLRAKIRLSEDQPEAKPEPSARYTALANDKYFADAEVRTETAVAFLEGPAVDRAGVVYFTNTPEHILRWDPRQKKLTVFREKSNQANGLRFDQQGRLVACENGRVTRTDMKTGQVTVLAEQYEGKPLGAPNDVEIDGQGRIYFTSRLPSSPLSPRGRGVGGEGMGNVNSVYRIDPPTAPPSKGGEKWGLARILAAPAIDMPNGIATSPDDKLLYLIDADGRDKHARHIRAYDLKSDGTTANERVLYDFYPGRSGDGMRVDAEGNLYVAAGLHRRRGTSETLATRPGIHVISPQGKLLAFLATPEDTITNCAFGGPDLRTLYVTCGKLLLSVRTRIPGKTTYRPEQ